MTQSPMLSAPGSNVADRYHSSFNQASGLGGALLVGWRIAFWDKANRPDAVVWLGMMLLVGLIALL